MGVQEEMNGTAEDHQGNDGILLVSKSIIWDRNRGGGFSQHFNYKNQKENLKNIGALTGKFWRKPRVHLTFPFPLDNTIMQTRDFFQFLPKKFHFLNDLTI